MMSPVGGDGKGGVQAILEGGYRRLLPEGRAFGKPLLKGILMGLGGGEGERTRELANNSWLYFAHNSLESASRFTILSQS